MKQYATADYDSRAVEAARRVLLELTRVLGSYDEEIAVVGGWVPPLLMPGAGHLGSTDVDVALDHEALQEPRYATLRALLERSGYYADAVQNYVFYRDVALGDGGARPHHGGGGSGRCRVWTGREEAPAVHVTGLSASTEGA